MGPGSNSRPLDLQSRDLSAARHVTNCATQLGVVEVHLNIADVESRQHFQYKNVGREKKPEICQCDTDAPALGHCMRKKVFIWDGMYGQGMLLCPF